MVLGIRPVVIKISGISMNRMHNIFENHTNFYGNVSIYPYDHYFLNFIRNTKGRLLDVGGGSGRFAIFVQDKYPTLDISVIDPSQSLLNMIEDERIKKFNGSLPDQLGLDDSQIYDYIHVKEVLHHVAGASIRESKEFVKQSLLNLKKHLNEEGILMVHELFYEGYIVPTLPRTFIFYLLKLQNSLNIKVPFNEFLLGLDVCFFTRYEFRSLLRDCGLDILDAYEGNWDNNIKKKMMLLENWGRMLFVLKKL